MIRRPPQPLPAALAMLAEQWAIDGPPVGEWIGHDEPPIEPPAPPAPWRPPPPDWHEEELERQRAAEHGD